MKVLIVGLGSIAQKHINALQLLDPKIQIVALRSGKNSFEHEEVLSIYSYDEIPLDIDFIIVSNPTSEHFESVRKLIGLKKPLFIEKPSFLDMKEAEKINDLVKSTNILTYTACNLRFHPAILWLKKNLKNYNILEVQVYCGSYLPEWRSNKDYTKNYSAIEELGGGVHLDLIHELDYTLWLFGLPLKSSVFTRKVSDLHISSKDSAHYFLEYPNLSVSILLNYFRRTPKRQIEIVTDLGVLEVDLLKSKITDENGKVIFKDVNPISETYTAQMRYFIDHIKKDKPMMNDLIESSITLNYSLNTLKK